MKKTLAILASLCVASFGASAVSITESNAQTYLDSAIYSQINITGGAGLTTVDIKELWSTQNTTDSTSGNVNSCFTLTATLRLSKLKEYIGNAATATSLIEVFSVHADTNGAKELGVKFGPISDNNGFIGFCGDNTYALTNYASSPLPAALKDIDLSAYTSAAITFTHLDLKNDYRDSGVTLTFLDDEGNATSYYGFTGKSLSWSGGLGSLQDIRFNTDLVSSIYLLEDRMQGSVAYLNAAAIAAIPEPATATLSLLALTGLAARRRRK